MRTQITLELERTGETYRGALFTAPDGSGLTTKQVDFDGVYYDDLMHRLSKELVKYEEVRVQIRQKSMFMGTERCHKYFLEEDLVRALVADPDATIRALSIGNRTVHVRDQKKTLPSMLRVGHATIADAFGDRVYLSVDPATLTVECAGCGRWMSKSASVFGNEVMTKCNNCNLEIDGQWQWGNDQAKAWVSVLVADLIRQGRDRYYIPRRWNPKQWITCVELTTMYETFVKEREQCFQTDSKV